MTLRFRSASQLMYSPSTTCRCGQHPEEEEPNTELVPIDRKDTCDNNYSERSHHRFYIPSRVFHKSISIETSVTIGSLIVHVRNDTLHIQFRFTSLFPPLVRDLQHALINHKPTRPFLISTYHPPALDERRKKGKGGQTNIS